MKNFFKTIFDFLTMDYLDGTEAYLNQTMQAATLLSPGDSVWLEMGYRNTRWNVAKIFTYCGTEYAALFAQDADTTDLAFKVLSVKEIFAMLCRLSRNPLGEGALVVCPWVGVDESSDDFFIVRSLFYNSEERLGCAVLQQVPLPGLVRTLHSSDFRSVEPIPYNELDSPFAQYQSVTVKAKGGCYKAHYVGFLYNVEGEPMAIVDYAMDESSAECQPPILEVVHYDNVSDYQAC